MSSLPHRQKEGMLIRDEPLQLKAVVTMSHSVMSFYGCTVLLQKDPEGISQNPSEFQETLASRKHFQPSSTLRGVERGSYCTLATARWELLARQKYQSMEQWELTVHQMPSSTDSCTGLKPLLIKSQCSSDNT